MRYRALVVGFLAALAAARVSAQAASCGGSAQCSSTQHTVTFQNSCNFPVWIANSAGTFGGAVLGGVACTQNSQCWVTLPDGTVDNTNAVCAGGFCSQINCTQTSGCPSSPPGLVSCNVPQCASSADCPAITCGSNSDCPSGSTCNSGNCTNLCNTTTGACACKAGGPGCPGAGTICDAPNGAAFGSCAGGTCWYSGLSPQNGPSGSPQWELAAACSSNSQCASNQTCNADNQCTCGSNADCAAVGGTCSSGVCVGQTATVCVPQGWGGRFWGRTGCTLTAGALQCQTGQCGTGASAALQCTNPAAGVSNSALGATLFESVFDSNSIDFWDLSLVNGYNLPVQASACNASGGAASCTFGGAAFTGFPVGCTSDLDQSCPAALQVTGSQSCLVTSDCPSGQTCGSNNLCSGTGATVTCIDPSDLCGPAGQGGFGLYANQTLLTPPASLQCNTAVTTSNPTTYNQYYGCAGALAAVSCNNAAVVCFADNDCPYAGQTCNNNVCWPVNSANNLAACVNGACNASVSQGAQYSCQTVNGSSLCLPIAPTTTLESGCCGAYNSAWLTAAQNANGGGTTTYTQVFRQACPDSYSFQYDDVASSFQCSDSAGTEVNYLVTFCAATATASPAAKRAAKPKAGG
ncbi:MAG TPA: thaumatin family protein [Thermoanaerobaculia bacterium]|jgi:hypothetical protein|nr:thaumatin family protein [Thermoanaerobaculia bacterium]